MQSEQADIGSDNRRFASQVLTSRLRWHNPIQTSGDDAWYGPAGGFAAYARIVWPYGADSAGALDPRIPGFSGGRAEELPASDWKLCFATAIGGIVAAGYWQKRLCCVAG